MKTEQEICQAIIKIELSTEAEYPEIAKYLGNIPAFDSLDPILNMIQMRDYYNSIETFTTYYSRYALRNNLALKKPTC